MPSWEFSFCFFVFISYAYICTCIRRHLKETIHSGSITCSKMGLLVILAPKVLFQNFRRASLVQYVVNVVGLRLLISSNFIITSILYDQVYCKCFDTYNNFTIQHTRRATNRKIQPAKQQQSIQKKRGLRLN